MSKKRTNKMPPGRRRRSDKKYDEKYTKELMDGLRYKERLTVAHLCMRWGICMTTYYNWIDRYPEFARAHAHGLTHYNAYLMDKLHDSLDGKKVNAASLQFALTNVMGWATRAALSVEESDSIGSITINIMEPPKQKSLEQLDSNIIEGEVIEQPDNVVNINGKS